MKKILTLILLACISVACTKEETPFNGNVPINISVNQLTKANDSEFEADDEVGIYVVNYSNSVAGTLALSGNHVDNMRFTYGGNVWTPDTPVYWKDKSTSADFYAYYPYSASLTSVNAHQFSVQADQSQEADFWASDFLYGKAENVVPTNSAVAIQMRHAMSRMLIEVKAGAGFTADSWTAAAKTVKISGVKTAAEIDLATGVAVASGSGGEIVPFNVSTNGTTASYKAMLVPQEVADGTKLIVITVDGVNYTYRAGFTFKANTVHKFTITVNKSAGKVDLSIQEWNVDDVVYEGEAVEEIEKINYVDEYGVNHGVGVEIDGIVWAPVDCGYHKTDYPYGKLYQWGRKYGQGLGGDYDNSQVELLDLGDGGRGIPLAEGQSYENRNKFFVTLDNDWLPYADRNPSLWNSGTEDNPQKTEYDPCPDGWRVPTKAELTILSKTYSPWNTFEDGIRGRYFYGSVAGADSILLLALFARDMWGGVQYMPNSIWYWSSAPDNEVTSFKLQIRDNDKSGVISAARAFAGSVRCVQILK